MPPAYLRFRHEFIALAPELYPAAFIDGEVEGGAWQCLGDDQAAILFTIKNYPSGVLELEGLAAAGDMDSILKLVREAEQWGREQGCALASIESREGWARMLPDYRPHQTRIVKEL